MTDIQGFARPGHEAVLSTITGDLHGFATTMWQAEV
jgi:hypothetical protein